MSARETEWEHCEIRLGSWLEWGSLGQDIEDYISNENKNHFIFMVKYLILYQDLSVQNIWIIQWYHLWCLATNILTRKQNEAQIPPCVYFSLLSWHWQVFTSSQTGGSGRHSRYLRKNLNEFIILMQKSVPSYS